MNTKNCNAGVTQLVESQPSKLLVAGSSPVSRSKNSVLVNGVIVNSVIVNGIIVNLIYIHIQFWYKKC